MNIGILRETALATTIALKEIRSHTQKAIDRSCATTFFVDVHGFFEANPAINRIHVEVDAEGGIGDEGQAYTSFSLAEIDVEVEPNVKQLYAYGFNDVEYQESGQIKLDTMDSLNERIENKRLIEAIRNRLEDCDDDEWFTHYLPYAVGTPKVVLSILRWNGHKLMV